MARPLKTRFSSINCGTKKHQQMRTFEVTVRWFLTRSGVVACRKKFSRRFRRWCRVLRSEHFRRWRPKSTRHCRGRLVDAVAGLVIADCRSSKRPFAARCSVTLLFNSSVPNQEISGGNQHGYAIFLLQHVSSRFGRPHYQETFRRPWLQNRERYNFVLRDRDRFSALQPAPRSPFQSLKEPFHKRKRPMAGPETFRATGVLIN